MKPSLAPFVQLVLMIISTPGIAMDTLVKDLPELGVAVELTGYVVKITGDRKFELSDQSGTVTVRCDGALHGLALEAGERVHVRGMPDRYLFGFGSRFVEADSVQVLESR